MRKTKNHIILLVVFVICLSSFFPIYAASNSRIYLFGLHDPDGGDRYSWMSNTAGQYKLQDSYAIVNQYNYFSSATIHNGLKNANYLTIHTHGSNSGIKAIDSNGTVSYLTTTAIRNGSSLSQLKVCYIAACSAAPVANAIQNKGAKTTIGYTKSVNTACNYLMHGSFNAYFTLGNSVSKSMSSAKSNVYSRYGTYGDVDSYVIYGDSSQTF